MLILFETLKTEENIVTVPLKYLMDKFQTKRKVKISNILFFVDRRPLLWEKTPKFCLPIKPHKWLKIRVLRKNLKKDSEGYKPYWNCMCNEQTLHDSSGWIKRKWKNGEKRT